MLPGKNCFWSLVAHFVSFWMNGVSGWTTPLLRSSGPGFGASVGFAGAAVLVGGAAGAHAATIAPASAMPPATIDRRLNLLFRPAKCVPPPQGESGSHHT